MNLINPSYEIIEQQGYDLNSIYKHIELCGRTCYKSEDKITEDSAEGFVKRMIDSNHTAMLEHGTVYLKINDEDYDEFSSYCPDVIKYNCNKYTKVNHVVDEDGVLVHYVTTNLRVIVENKWWDDMKYLCEPTEHHYKRHTVRLTTSIHVYKDLTRHRTMSFAIESTRYCNYTKGKFGGDLTFIDPVWKKDNHGAYEQFISALHYANTYYKFLVQAGWKAEQAAEVLPQCTKADVIITGFENDWDHIFNLRALGTTGAPHPEVKRIIEPIMKDFYEREWTNCFPKRV